MSRTTIVLGEDLQEQAKENDVNVSHVCREAVKAAIEAKVAARRLSNGFERIDAWLADDNGDPGEKVRFTGRLLHSDKTGNDYYITAGGDPAVVLDSGILWYGFEDGIQYFDGYVGQLLEEALGEVVKPTELDI